MYGGAEMKTEEEIRNRYWFLKGNKAGLQYARCERSCSNNFENEIKEVEHQIAILTWMLESEAENE